jgi:hypothetical protein
MLAFGPILFAHKNLMGYRLLEPRITGAPLRDVPRKMGRWPVREDTSLHLLFVPYKAFLAREISKGHVPLWNPLIACGQPVASDPDYHIFSPFLLPFLLSPSAWTYSLGIALTALFGMVGFALYWGELGLDPWLAALGGVLLAFNPLTQQTLVLSSAWGLWCLAWAFWGCERWMRRKRWGFPLLVTGAALVLYAGHPVVGVFYLLMLGAYYWFSSGEPPRRRVAWGAVAAAGTFLLAAPVIWPFLAQVGMYQNCKTLSDGGPYIAWWQMTDPSSTAYIPLPVWALAAVAVAGGRRPQRWFFFGLAICGFVIMAPYCHTGVGRWVLSLGGTLIAAHGEEALRLGLMWLAVAGVFALSHRSESSHKSLVFRGLLYGAAWYYIFAWLASEWTFEPFAPTRHAGLSVMELACWGFLVAASWEPPGALMRQVFAVCGALVIAALPLILPMRLWRLCSEMDFTRPETAPPAVRRMLDEGAAGGRWRFTGEYVMRADGMTDLAPNQGMNWGLSDIRTTNPMVLSNFMNFAQHWQTSRVGFYPWFPRADDELLRFLGVRWVVGDSVPPSLKGWGQRRPCELKVREIENSEEWVRTVGLWQVEPDESRQFSQTFRVIHSGMWRSTAILDRAPDLRPSQENCWRSPNITWIEDGPNRWKWRIEGSDPSVLVVLQNAHPNWRAKLDGRPVPILRAYGTFQALAVPKGLHVAEMEYHEVWFWAGLAASGGVVVLFFGGLLVIGAKCHGAEETTKR